MHLQTQFSSISELIRHIFRSKGIEPHSIFHAFRSGAIDILDELILLLLERREFRDKILEPGHRYREYVTEQVLGIGKQYAVFSKTYPIGFLLSLPYHVNPLLVEILHILRSKQITSPEDYTIAMMNANTRQLSLQLETKYKFLRPYWVQRLLMYEAWHGVFSDPYENVKSWFSSDRQTIQALITTFQVSSTVYTRQYANILESIMEHIGSVCHTPLARLFLENITTGRFGSKETIHGLFSNPRLITRVLSQLLNARLQVTHVEILLKRQMARRGKDMNLETKQHQMLLDYYNELKKTQEAFFNQEEERERGRTQLFSKPLDERLDVLRAKAEKFSQTYDKHQVDKSSQLSRTHFAYEHTSALNCDPMGNFISIQDLEVLREYSYEKIARIFDFLFEIVHTIGFHQLPAESQTALALIAHHSDIFTLFTLSPSQQQMVYSEQEQAYLLYCHQLQSIETDTHFSQEQARWRDLMIESQLNQKSKSHSLKHVLKKRLPRSKIPLIEVQSFQDYILYNISRIILPNIDLSTLQKVYSDRALQLAQLSALHTRRKRKGFYNKSLQDHQLKQLTSLEHTLQDLQLQQAAHQPYCDVHPVYLLTNPLQYSNDKIEIVDIGGGITDIDLDEDFFIEFEIYDDTTGTTTPFPDDLLFDNHAESQGGYLLSSGQSQGPRVDEPDDPSSASKAPLLHDDDSDDRENRIQNRLIFKQSELDLDSPTPDTLLKYHLLSLTNRKHIMWLTLMCIEANLTDGITYISTISRRTMNQLSASLNKSLISVACEYEQTTPKTLEFLLDNRVKFVPSDLLQPKARSIRLNNTSISSSELPAASAAIDHQQKAGNYFKDQPFFCLFYREHNIDTGVFDYTLDKARLLVQFCRKYKISYGMNHDQFQAILIRMRQSMCIRYNECAFIWYYLLRDRSFFTQSKRNATEITLAIYNDQNVVISRYFSQYHKEEAFREYNKVIRMVFTRQVIQQLYFARSFTIGSLEQLLTRDMYTKLLLDREAIHQHRVSAGEFFEPSLIDNPNITSKGTGSLSEVDIQRSQLDLHDVLSLSNNPIFSIITFRDIPTIAYLLSQGVPGFGALSYLLKNSFDSMDISDIVELVDMPHLVDGFHHHNVSDCRYPMIASDMTKGGRESLSEQRSKDPVWMMIHKTTDGLPALAPEDERENDLDDGITPIHGKTDQEKASSIVKGAIKPPTAKQIRRKKAKIYYLRQLLRQLDHEDPYRTDRMLQTTCPIHQCTHCDPSPAFQQQQQPYSSLNRMMLSSHAHGGPWNKDEHSDSLFTPDVSPHTASSPFMMYSYHDDGSVTIPSQTLYTRPLRCWSCVCYFSPFTSRVDVNTLLHKYVRDRFPYNSAVAPVTLRLMSVPLRLVKKLCTSIMRIKDLPHAIEKTLLNFIVPIVDQPQHETIQKERSRHTLLFSDQGQSLNQRHGDDNDDDLSIFDVFGFIQKVLDYFNPGTKSVTQETANERYKTQALQKLQRSGAGHGSIDFRMQFLLPEHDTMVLSPDQSTSLNHIIDNASLDFKYAIDDGTSNPSQTTEGHSSQENASSSEFHENVLASHHQITSLIMSFLQQHTTFLSSEKIQLERRIISTDFETLYPTPAEKISVFHRLLCVHTTMQMLGQSPLSPSSSKKATHDPTTMAYLEQLCAVHSSPPMLQSKFDQLFSELYQHLQKKSKTAYNPENPLTTWLLSSEFLTHTHRSSLFELIRLLLLSGVQLTDLVYENQMGLGTFLASTFNYGILSTLFDIHDHSNYNHEHDKVVLSSAMYNIISSPQNKDRLGASQIHGHNTMDGDDDNNQDAFTRGTSTERDHHTPSSSDGPMPATTSSSNGSPIYIKFVGNTVYIYYESQSHTKHKNGKTNQHQITFQTTQSDNSNGGVSGGASNEPESAHKLIESLHRKLLEQETAAEKADMSYASGDMELFLDYIAQSLSSDGSKNPPPASSTKKASDSKFTMFTRNSASGHTPIRFSDYIYVVKFQLRPNILPFRLLTRFESPQFVQVYWDAEDPSNATPTAQSIATQILPSMTLHTLPNAKSSSTSPFYDIAFDSLAVLTQFTSPHAYDGDIFALYHQDKVLEYCLDKYMLSAVLLNTNSIHEYMYSHFIKGLATNSPIQSSGTLPQHDHEILDELHIAYQKLFQSRQVHRSHSSHYTDEQMTSVTNRMPELDSHTPSRDPTSNNPPQNDNDENDAADNDMEHTMAPKTMTIQSTGAVVTLRFLLPIFRVLGVSANSNLLRMISLVHSFTDAPIADMIDEFVASGGHLLQSSHRSRRETSENTIHQRHDTQSFGTHGDPRPKSSSYTRLISSLLRENLGTFLIMIHICVTSYKMHPDQFTDAYGNTLLIQLAHASTIAIDNSFQLILETIRTLVQHYKIDINQRNKFGYSAFMVACMVQNIAVLRALLLDGGCDVLLVDACGRSALMLTIENMFFSHHYRCIYVVSEFKKLYQLEAAYKTLNRDLLDQTKALAQTFYTRQNALKESQNTSQSISFHDYYHTSFPTDTLQLQHWCSDAALTAVFDPTARPSDRIPSSVFDTLVKAHQSIKDQYQQLSLLWSKSAELEKQISHLRQQPYLSKSTVRTCLEYMYQYLVQQQWLDPSATPSQTNQQPDDDTLAAMPETGIDAGSVHFTITTNDSLDNKMRILLSSHQALDQMTSSVSVRWGTEGVGVQFARLQHQEDMVRHKGFHAVLSSALCSEVLLLIAYTLDTTDVFNHFYNNTEEPHQGTSNNHNGNLRYQSESVVLPLTTTSMTSVENTDFTGLNLLRKGIPQSMIQRLSILSHRYMRLHQSKMYLSPSILLSLTEQNPNQVTSHLSRMRHLMKLDAISTAESYYLSYNNEHILNNLPQQQQHRRHTDTIREKHSDLDIGAELSTWGESVMPLQLNTIDTHHNMKDIPKTAFTLMNSIHTSGGPNTYPPNTAITLRSISTPQILNDELKSPIYDALTAFISRLRLVFIEAFRQRKLRPNTYPTFDDDFILELFKYDF